LENILIHAGLWIIAFPMIYLLYKKGYKDTKKLETKYLLKVSAFSCLAGFLSIELCRFLGH